MRAASRASEHATERVVAAPEPASDLPRLVEIVEDNGWTYETSKTR